MILNIKPLCNFGAKYSKDREQSKKIVLTNQIIILLGSVTFFESFFYIVFGFFKTSLMTFGVVLLYLGCFYLNAIGMINLSRYLLMFLINAGVFSYSLLLGQGSGMQSSFLLLYV